MEKTDEVREAINKLIANYIGESTAHYFVTIYKKETLPMNVNGAIKILEEFIGPEKTKSELEEIFSRYHVENTYV